MRFYIIILAWLLMAAGCVSEKKAQYESLKCDNIEALTVRDLNDSVSLGFGSKVIVYDSLLVVFDELQPNRLHFFEKSTGREVGSFGHIGQGDKELIAPANMYVESRGILSLYDSGSGKLLEASLNESNLSSPAAWNVESLPEYEVRPKEVYRMADDRLIGVHGRPRFSLSNPDGVVATYDVFPALPEVEVEDGSERMFFLTQTLLAVRPDGKKMVQATTVGSIMEIFQISDASIEPTDIKYFDKPVFSVERGQISLSPETVYGFACLDATESSIYATLHGVANPTKFPSDIYVFDWKGNPEQKLTASNLQIVCFSVDASTGEIYAIALGDDGEQKLVVLSRSK